MYTLDGVIQDNKEFLKELITKFEKELNSRDFETIYKDISSRHDYIFTISFTALLLKNNINPLKYMDEVPDCFAKALDIKKFIIPANVTSIGYWAFEDCVNLSSIEVPDSVTIISGSAFWGCKSLSSIEIPKSVTIIGENAFYNCSRLAEITIPSSVTSIGDSAFHNCPKLKDIYYEGSEEDWKNINIEDDNDDLLNANIHYNS